MKFTPLLLSGCAYGTAIGFLQPSLSLLLAEVGVSNAQIALVSTSAPAGLLLFSFFVPALLERVGVIPAFLAATLLEIGAIVALAHVDSWGLSLTGVAMLAGCLRMLSGATSAISWIALESSVNNAIDPNKRGKLIAIYSVAIAVGFAIGPQLLPLLEIFAARALLLAAVIMLGAMFLALSSQVLEKWFNPEHVGVSLPRSGWPLLLIILLLGFCGGFTETFVYVILPLHWLADIEAGLSAQYLLSAFTIGSICAQIPIGRYLDKYRWQPLVLLAFTTSTLLLIWMRAIDDWQQPVAIVAMMLWGACIDSMFMTSLYLQGKHFRNYLLARVTSWYVAFCTLGMLSAPASSSLVFSIDAGALFWLPIALYCAMVLILLASFIYGKLRDLHQD